MVRVLIPSSDPGPGRTVVPAFGLLLALLPMAAAGFAIFAGAGERLVSLYPLLLLPLFLSRKDKGHPRFGGALILPGILFVLVGIVLHRMSLVWAGSFWNALAVLRLGGLSVSPAAALLIFCVPPVSEFPAVALGFELRLFLTHLAGNVLSHFDPATTVDGSRIFTNGLWVTVDRACEGLKMGGASFLFWISLGNHTSLRGRFLAAALLPALWLAANLSRILALIAFGIPAGSTAHEIIGVVFFLSVIVFPIGIIALLLPGTPEPPAGAAPRSSLTIVHVALLGGIAGALFLYPRQPAAAETWPTRIGTFILDPGSTLSDPRIAVYQSGQMHLILKRGLFFLGTAHDPRICFSAAGFSLNETGPARAGEIQVRRAIIEKESKQILYWWFGWPGGSSPSDWEWRVRRIAGDDVIQWNLSGPDETVLRRTAAELAAHCAAARCPRETP